MFHCTWIKYLLILMLGCLATAAMPAQYFVATDGDDAQEGTIDSPFATISRAILAAGSGDTIYVRGGTYETTSTINISSSMSGTENEQCYLTAYQDERPLLDFSAQSFGSRGMTLRASYWVIRGLQIKGAGDNGLQIREGGHNIIENCAFFENRDTGLQISAGSSHNRIINCDSYYNADPSDYGDADGFAPKLDVGTDNTFYGCRSWGNCDDGWDGYMRGATEVRTTLENCWTWGNGWLKDGTDPGSQANGNGFKMGGGDNSNAEELKQHVIQTNCVAAGNKNKGFDQNNNMGSMTLYNCTGYGNLTANYRIQRALPEGEILTLKNCASYSGAVQLGSFAVEEANSWSGAFTVTAEDFLSLDTNELASPRKADGSLPDIDFMHLTEGSDLIDAGADLGFPYNGSAPDLGAFETDYSSEVRDIQDMPRDFALHQNFPNPFNPTTEITYILAKESHVRLVVYDALGREIATPVQDIQSAGQHSVQFDGSNLSSGMYVCVLETDRFRTSQKLLLMK